MKAAQIREAFLHYFKKNGHAIVESSSLVPQNDPTLLFTNAGMVQFKDVFLGKETRPYKRATTSQKCVRAGGKHNDLENVGFTARHHTFFEMLGNFSFGDYFKKDAIHFAWEFVLKELKLPEEKLYVTVFKDDDEAADIWHKQEKVPLDRIYRFGEKDNFWAMGDTGPCGPCSEIFIDRGEKYGCGKSTCAMGCDCDRYMEFWNLVFMQFDRSADGKLTPLPKPSVDTGAGLERIASILQNAETNYDTDVFQEIISKTAMLGKIKDLSEAKISLRVIADHARATTFLVGDGVMPSNEGRGYVLRRIMRRAIRHGKKIGFEAPFLNQVCGYVIDQMKDAYPDLKDKRAFIEKAVQAEEEQFFRTLERGLALLDEEIAKMGSNKTLSGEVAFKLYDTFGFPLDLTRVICAEKNLSLDEAGFETAMERQRTESRKHWKGSGEEAVDSVYHELAEKLRPQGKMPVFVGYEKFEAEGECLAVLPSRDGKAVDAVFSVTPFYGESGGQAGDKGHVTGHGFDGVVEDVKKPTGDLIVVKIQPKQGQLQVGKKYHQSVSQDERSLTARNHTATHLLHWALREVLGKHVKQAGSLVNSALLRFDFTHFQPMTKEEITKVENLVNEKIWHNHGVSKNEMNKDAAIASGAIAFFGEKYGDKVRVVKVGEFSTELCGGTHVNQSGDIHLFKIGNENGIAAGVRRIVAYTSKGAFDYLSARDEEVKKIRDRLRASSSDEILGKIDKLFDSEKQLKQEIEKLESQKRGGEADEILKNAVTLGNIQLMSLVYDSHPQGVKHLRELAEQIKNKAPTGVVVLGLKDGDKAVVIAAVGAQAIGTVDANAIVREASPIINGRGGGKPDLAQAGGTNAAGLREAVEHVKEWLKEKLDK